jgi:hypothetical protein
MRSALFLGAVLVGSACASEEPRTQVMAVVDADEGVRRDTARLRIVIRSGAAFEEVRLDQTIGGEGRPIAWPVRIALVPQDDDASRTFEVEAEALSSTNVRNGIVRARSGYVPRRTKELAGVPARRRTWRPNRCRTSWIGVRTLERGMLADFSTRDPLIPDHSTRVA